MTPLPKGKNHMPWPHSDKPRRHKLVLLPVHRADYDRIEELAAEVGISKENVVHRLIEDWYGVEYETD